MVIFGASALSVHDEGEENIPPRSSLFPPLLFGFISAMPQAGWPARSLRACRDSAAGTPQESISDDLHIPRCREVRYLDEPYLGTIHSRPFWTGAILLFFLTDDNHWHYWDITEDLRIGGRFFRRREGSKPGRFHEEMGREEPAAGEMRNKPQCHTFYMIDVIFCEESVEILVEYWFRS
jgi:hypothetical protein